MPRRPAIARERLARLLQLPAAAIAHEMGGTPDHVTACYASTASPARRRAV